jgi:hypothetical protein
MTVLTRSRGSIIETIETSMRGTAHLCIYNLADALVDSHLSDFDEKNEKVDKTQN